jgi:uncharacterized surface protein with fasciclin (FAS1) repeats
MKINQAFANILRRYALSALMVMAGMVTITFTACSSDDIDSESYYTFTGETVTSYCENRPSTFSVFSQIIKDAELETLLAVYGHYTCFIPSDSAFNVYFQEKGISYESLTKEDKTNIVYNHIIRGQNQNFMTRNFSEGALSAANMNNRFMVISYEKNGEEANTILVNKVAKITVPDVELHNGVIHVIDHVLVPSEESVGSLLSTLAQYSLFAKAMELTHLGDSMRETYDMSYKNPYSTEYVNVLGYTMKTLHQKKLGYTVFAEPDSVFHAAGINTIDDLMAFSERYYGSKDEGDYTSRNNALNKFVSYHLLNRQMSTNSFIYTGRNTSSTYMDKRFEYYETMLQYRLMEIKAGNKINTQKSGESVTLNENASNISAANGFIHCLNNILVYDENIMRNDVLNKRIRFDAFAIAPEMTNNNIRWHLVDNDSYTMPGDYCGDYFKFNDATKFIMWGSESWNDYQADEISLRGWYDFTVRMLPVPPGTWEIRLGYSVRDWGGLAQIFIDNKIIGIPVDFVTKGSDPKIGFVKDSETSDNGVENDKMMRNRGYLKGPASAYNANYYTSLRDAEGNLRLILDTRSFQDYAPHYMRAKNIQSENGEFHFDFIEYCPVNLIENEDRD